MSSRRQARRMALQMLFQADVAEQTAPYVVNSFFRNRKCEPETAEFARKLFLGAFSDRQMIDGWIRQHTEHWRMERMATVDRNILRMAVYEMVRRPDTPPAVILNEALEIAREFSGENAVEFINGVLDNIRKAMNPPPVEN